VQKGGRGGRRRLGVLPDPSEGFERRGAHGGVSILQEGDDRAKGVLGVGSEGADSDSGPGADLWVSVL
jgi:hypothetical protein